MQRTRFHSILQNLHYSNNDSDDKTDKSSKIWPVIKQLNKVFAESLSNSTFESVDEQMFKFIDRSSMKQYIKNNQYCGALNIGIDATVKQVTSIN